jgi:hypothetical protein
MYPYKCILRIIHRTGCNCKRLHGDAEAIYINMSDYHSGKFKDINIEHRMLDAEY